MRRQSTKKSSMFKVQADKNVYKAFLDSVDQCETVRKHPHLLDSISNVAQIVYDYCYNFSEETPFSKGMNYGCKNYGVSFPSANILILREWIPNAKEVYLVGDFNEFNETSHPMEIVEDEKDIYSIELDMSENKINNESRILLRIVDCDGNVHKMPPPSCKIRSKDFAYICVDIGLPVIKNQKKHDIMIAYTIDLSMTPLKDALNFVELNEASLGNFNTIILRKLFVNTSILDQKTLDLEEIKYLRDLVSKIKYEMGLRVIIEWSFEPGTIKYGVDNPIEKELLRRETDKNLWEYDIEKEEVASLYLANLSYFLSTFQIDGFHFKHIDTFCKTQKGQVLLKCMNIMNQRLHENGFTLASCKKEIPGLNYPILEGGFGFTFTYNYRENFLACENASKLKAKFDHILQSSNCVAINLDEITQEHELNFIFAVLVSGKGIFCKGSFTGKEDIISKTFRIRRQPELFSEGAFLSFVEEDILLASRGKTNVIFNFKGELKTVSEEKFNGQEVIWSSGEKDAQHEKNVVELPQYSCCVLEGNQE